MRIPWAQRGLESHTHCSLKRLALLSTIVTRRKYLLETEWGAYPNDDLLCKYLQV